MIKPILKENKVVFGPCRLSYTHLFEKWSMEGSTDEGQYCTNVLIPKDEKETIKAIEEAIAEAKKSAIVNKWKGVDPKKLMLPLSDGDEKDTSDDTYSNHYYINAKCNTKPGVVDKNKMPITDEEEIYSGVWAICSVTFYGYDFGGKKGIACGLNNVMKFKDDERLGGRISADSDFEDVSFDEDDDL